MIYKGYFFCNFADDRSRNQWAKKWKSAILKVKVLKTEVAGETTLSRVLELFFGLLGCLVWGCGNSNRHILTNMPELKEAEITEMSDREIM